MVPQDVVDEWIASVVRGKSFVDIGGIGEFATNERTCWAKYSGASKAAVADFEPFDHHLWRHYRQETKRLGIIDIEFYEKINIDDPSLRDKIGEWDIVHSTGILYHVPNPVHSILNLRRIVRSHLIINTVIVPQIIENAAGRLDLPAAGVLFAGALRGTDRQVMLEYYQEKFGLDISPSMPTEVTEGSMPYMRNGRPSYYPYWWLFTKHSFETVSEILGMRVRDRFTWREHAHFLFLEVV
jgi:hypothetical protein